MTADDTKNSAIEPRPVTSKNILPFRCKQNVLICIVSTISKSRTTLPEFAEFACLYFSVFELKRKYAQRRDATLRRKRCLLVFFISASQELPVAFLQIYFPPYKIQHMDTVIYGLLDHGGLLTKHDLYKKIALGNATKMVYVVVCILSHRFWNFSPSCTI